MRNHGLLAQLVELLFSAIDGMVDHARHGHDHKEQSYKVEELVDKVSVHGRGKRTLDASFA